MENHRINLENRNKLAISEVEDIDAFDEDVILVNLYQSGMIVKGKKLNIIKLDLEEGLLEVTGIVDSISYTEKKNKLKKNKNDFINRLPWIGHK